MVFNREFDLVLAQNRLNPRQCFDACLFKCFKLLESLESLITPPAQTRRARNLATRSFDCRDVRLKIGQIGVVFRKRYIAFEVRL